MRDAREGESETAKVHGTQYEKSKKEARAGSIWKYKRVVVKQLYNI